MFSLSSWPRRYAYFSMEIGLEDDIPTYAGGLGILAGDTVRSAADLGVPLVAVTLLHRHGYFYQRIVEAGVQLEEPVRWPVDDYLDLTPCQFSLEIDSFPVQVAVWQRMIRGIMGQCVPVYFLDTKLDCNRPEHQGLTDSLYGGDHPYRLRQELLLGEGGIRALRALGHTSIVRYHLNEGHAALAAVELIREVMESDASLSPVQALSKVRPQIVFTTHTPIPAGHDRFSPDIYTPILGHRRVHVLCSLGQSVELNMTDLALRASGYVNGVALRHGQISRGMFPHYPISSITNGVHAERWAAPAIAALFDRHLPDWRKDPQYLRYAIEIEKDELWSAHMQAKCALIEFVNNSCNAGFDRDVLTLGFARRMTAYKRPLLLFRDVDRLRSIAACAGPMQVVCAGKAHPHDWNGKELIKQLCDLSKQLGGSLKVIYVPNYDIRIAGLCCSGVDVWLNTPLRPLEASGTSGMKAAVNGVPSLSIRDGWWVEGYVEGVTGWDIGDSSLLPAEQADITDAQSLYAQLEQRVLPAYYHQREMFKELMRHAISINGSFFNTQRMLWQYLHVAYNNGSNIP